MLKRRDWLLLNKDRAASSSSDDNSADDAAAEAASAAAGTGREEHVAVVGSQSDDQADSASRSGSDAKPGDSEAGTGPSDMDDDVEHGSSAKWQMPSDSEGNATGSEEDNSSPDEEDHHPDRPRAQEVARVWLQTPAKQAHRQRGSALRCRVCPSVLLLSAGALQSHVASKKHRKAAGSSSGSNVLEDVLLFVYADEAVPAEEETETHAERLERLEQLQKQLQQEQVERAAALAAAQQAGTAVSISKARRDRRKAKKAAIAARKAAKLMAQQAGPQQLAAPASCTPAAASRQAQPPLGGDKQVRKANGSAGRLEMSRMKASDAAAHATQSKAKRSQRHDGALPARRPGQPYGTGANGGATVKVGAGSAVLRVQRRPGKRQRAVKKATPTPAVPL